MSGTSILGYLRALCSDMDAGRPLRRFHDEWPRALVAVAVPIAIGLAGAGCAREDCRDGVDNDGDRLVDVADPDCVNVAPPSYAEYAAPFQPDDVAPPSNAEYAAPNPRDDVAPPPVGAYGAPPVQAYRAPFPSDDVAPQPDVKPPEATVPPAIGQPPMPVPAYGVPPAPPPPALSPNPGEMVPLYGLPPSSQGR